MRASNNILSQSVGVVYFLALIMLAAPLAAPRAAQSLDARILRIGTGGKDGTYFPIGRLIAQALSDGGASCAQAAGCGVPGLLAVAQLSNGSVSNVEAINDGALEAGLAQADVAAWAFDASGIFSGKPRHPGLRAVAALYAESLQVVVRKDSDIHSIGDLRGRRVSLDEPGSGTLVDTRIVLSAYGLKEADLRSIYVKPQFAIRKLMRGELDAFFIIAGYPTRSITGVAEQYAARLLPINGAPRDSLVARYPFLSANLIPAHTYPGIGATPTVAVEALLLVSADLPADLVYRITRTLWSERTRSLLDQGHPKGREIRIEHALRGIAIPLHPGAKRYYEEVGLSTAVPPAGSPP